MKTWVILLLSALLLTGCASEDTFETIADEPVAAVMAQPGQISVELPEDAVAPVLESGSEQLWLCDDYEILIQTRPSGDLNGTIQTISGYPKESLTVIETQNQNVTRYDFVWASAGEKGERLGRAVVLDDGNYHYCMSVLRDADAQESQIVWNEVFQSFSLVE